MIGAGITGLVLTRALRRAGHEVTLLEATNRTGGTIATTYASGCVVELGPESLRPGSAEAWALVTELGLTAEVVEADEAAKRRYLLLEDGLVPVPSSTAEALSRRMFRRRDLVRALAEPFVPRMPRRNGTVHAVLARRLGRGIADQVADPVIAGIFAGDAHALEFASVFARVQALEDAHGSWVVGGLRGPRGPKPGPRVPYTFRRGMQTLTDAVAQDIWSDLRLRSPVTGISRDGGRLTVLAGPATVTVDKVVVTAPAHASARFLDADLAGWPHAPVAAVHLAWPADALPAPLDGFGWLAHSRVRRDVLGAIWVSAVFPSHADGLVVIRAMVGGTRAPRLVDRSDDALVAHTRQVLREVQGIRAAPVWTHVARHRPGIPQYTVGHAGRLARVRDALPPGVHLAGWGYDGIGVADGIIRATALAAELGG